jgi:uncharacterized OB-fold protein
MTATKRPQNKCKSCGYTWYPRGKSISIKCPNCGGGKISTVGSWGGVVVVGFLVYGFFGNHQEPEKANAVVAPIVAASQAGESMALQTNKSSVEYPGKEEVLKSEPKVQFEHKIQSNVSVIEEEALTPTFICKNKGNYFARNGCMWKECEKAEFSVLQECADKKPKESGAEN